MMSQKAYNSWLFKKSFKFKDEVYRNSLTDHRVNKDDKASTPIKSTDKCLDEYLKSKKDSNK